MACLLYSECRSIIAILVIEARQKGKDCRRINVLEVKYSKVAQQLATEQVGDRIKDFEIYGFDDMKLLDVGSKASESGR